MIAQPYPPQLVIFDCDGVLVDSEMIASQVLADLLTRMNFKITAKDCRERFTGKSIRSVRTMVEKQWGRALGSDFEENLRTFDRQAFEKNLRPVDGIKEALEGIPVPLCVASSGTPEKIKNSLDLTGLSNYFAGNLFSSTMVANGKPAPDLFQYAAAQMKSFPQHAVVIEDSPSGIIAAGLANIQVLGYSGASHARDDPEYEGRLRNAGAEIVFDDMAKLPELLGF